MKENTNIEELFKSKLEAFEGNVDPSAWANISQSIGSGTTVAGSVVTGVSLVTKVAIITGVVAATTLSVLYFSSMPDNNTETVQDNNEVVVEEVGVQNFGENILVNDTNDPVLQGNINEIENELSLTHYTVSDIDKDFLEEIINENNFSSSFIVNSQNLNLVDNKEDVAIITSDDIITEDNKEDEKNVVNDILPIEQKEISSNLVIDIGESNSVEFKSNANNHREVIWSFGDGSEGSGDEITHIYERPGKYYVKMEVLGNGQSDGVERIVTIKGTSKIGTIANVITPNGDGSNDFFFVSSEGLENFYISITDKRGVEVFASSDPDFEWNGENLSNEIIRGSYIVVIIAEGEDGQIFKEMKALQIQ